MTAALIIGDVQVGIVETLFPGAAAVLPPLAAGRALCVRSSWQPYDK